jgi:hypothetical protein
MAYDEHAAERVRHALSNVPELTEQKLMGALTFMVGGTMCCGVTGEDLMVRVGSAAYDAALAEPHVLPMEIGRGRRPRGFIRVAPAGYRTDKALAGWVKRGVAFALTLPRR